jgi:transcriptional regulator with XRE-family HTH domain
MLMHDDRDQQGHEGQRRFARNLRAARKRAQFTQGDVAEALGISDTIYARYEAAKTWPGIGRLRHLCQILGCSADVLLGYRDLEAGLAAPTPPGDAPRLRWLLRRFRLAPPELVEAAHRMLDLLDRHGLGAARDREPSDDA